MLRLRGCDIGAGCVTFYRSMWGERFITLDGGQLDMVRLRCCFWYLSIVSTAGMLRRQTREVMPVVELLFEGNGSRIAFNCIISPMHFGFIMVSDQ